MAPRVLRLLISGLTVVIAAGLGMLILSMVAERGKTRNARLPSLSYEELTGSVFSANTNTLLGSPVVRPLSAPDFTGATAIWGSTGRDSRGHIWAGFSGDLGNASARLFEFDPGTGAWVDRGAVVDKLREAGLLHPEENQVKIHSRIVGGSDGYLYFSSSDEKGEKEDGSAPPRWGGHLWRIDPASGRWQHLLAAKEALIAVAGVGRYIYTLGYWGHVLYQYDTLTGQVRRKEVGSVGGHTTRNIIADVRGHVFVPRPNPVSGGVRTASLVEFDEQLREIAANPLEAYFGAGDPSASHGITGLAYLQDGGIAFVTTRGYLHLIEAPPRDAASRPARVRPVGWFNPGGEAYASGLFALGRRRIVGGIAMSNRGFEWTIADLETGASAAHKIDLTGFREVLLYGSITRDNDGRAYVVGWHGIPRGKAPFVVQLGP